MLTLEYILVALIVLGCGIFSVWRLLSARLRLRLLEALGSLAGDTGGTGMANAPAVRATLLSGWLRRLRSRTVNQLNGGCGTCSSGGQSQRRVVPSGGSARSFDA